MSYIERAICGALSRW